MNGFIFLGFCLYCRWQLHTDLLETSWPHQRGWGSLGMKAVWNTQVVTVRCPWNLHLLKLFWKYSTDKLFDKVMTALRQNKWNNGYLISLTAAVHCFWTPHLLEQYRSTLDILSSTLQMQINKDRAQLFYLVFLQGSILTLLLMSIRQRMATKVPHEI